MCALAFAGGNAALQQTSPDGSFTLDVDVTETGIPFYSLSYKGNPIVEQSRLGLKAKETDFSEGFHIQDSAKTTVDETWQPVWGEYSEVRIITTSFP